MTPIHQARWLIGSLRMFSVTYGCLLKFQRSVKRHFKREDELDSNVYSVCTKENSVKEIPPLFKAFFVAKEGGIKIKRNVRLFSSTLSSSFSCSLLLFFCFRVILWPTGVAKSKSIWVIWCKVLTRFSYIHPFIHITSGMITSSSRGEFILSPQIYLDAGGYSLWQAE